MEMTAKELRWKPMEVMINYWSKHSHSISQDSAIDRITPSHIFQAFPIQVANGAIHSLSIWPYEMVHIRKVRSHGSLSRVQKTVTSNFEVECLQLWTTQVGCSIQTLGLRWHMKGEHQIGYECLCGSFPPPPPPHIRIPLRNAPPLGPQKFRNHQTLLQVRLEDGRRYWRHFLGEAELNQ